MTAIPPPIKKIYVDAGIQNDDFTRRLLNNLKKYGAYNETEIETVNDTPAVIEHYSRNSLSIQETKDILMVLPNRARFVKACPGSDGVVCCHYFIINLGSNCPYDCRYCYLQSFLNQPLLTVFSNVKDLLAEVKEKVQSKPAMHWRIGTGEYTDSLALDHLTGYSTDLVPFFAELPNATLELKTKSVEIDNLLNMNPAGNTIVSWSLNPQRIIDEVEHKTSTLEDRLNAAVQVAEYGYWLAFHFDPLIWYENWEQEYQQVIDLVFNKVPAGKIRYISLGTFRFSPGLKEAARRAEPGETITRAEMFPGEDGKFRYMAHHRAQMYTGLKQMIQKKDHNQFVYLCMETQEMWQRVEGFNPRGPKQLDNGFEKRRQTIEAHS